MPCRHDGRSQAVGVEVAAQFVEQAPSLRTRIERVQQPVLRAREVAEVAAIWVTDDAALTARRDAVQQLLYERGLARARRAGDGQVQGFQLDGPRVPAEGQEPMSFRHGRGLPRLCSPRADAPPEFARQRSFSQRDPRSRSSSSCARRAHRRNNHPPTTAAPLAPNPAHSVSSVTACRSILWPDIAEKSRRQPSRAGAPRPRSQATVQASAEMARARTPQTAARSMAPNRCRRNGSDVSHAAPPRCGDSTRCAASCARTRLRICASRAAASSRNSSNASCWPPSRGSARPMPARASSWT